MNLPWKRPETRAHEKIARSRKSAFVGKSVSWQARLVGAAALPVAVAMLLWSTSTWPILLVLGVLATSVAVLGDGEARFAAHIWRYGSHKRAIASSARVLSAGSFFGFLVSPFVAPALGYLALCLMVLGIIVDVGFSIAAEDEEAGL